MATISIDPITRIEGHLGIKVETEGGKVTEAFCKGEMFRGFEQILKGRSPLDAQQITQRICGVCPVSHGLASVQAQDAAFGVSLNRNGLMVRNLILGANYIQSHILHFYHLCALDYVDIKAILKYEGKDRALNNLKDWVGAQVNSKALYPAAPFLPRYEGDYIQDASLNFMAVKHYLDALEMRAEAHKMIALFGGKAPHVATLVPGGVTEQVTLSKIAAYSSMLRKLQGFIDNAYIPDVLAVASAYPTLFDIGKGCGNFLAYGVFPEKEDGSEQFLPAGVLTAGKLEGFDAAKITEDVKYSHFSSPSGLAPEAGETTAKLGKEGAYTWLKAPRYDGKVMEVGPLARILVAYMGKSNAGLNKMVDGVLKQVGKKPSDLISAAGRHAARALECKVVADQCAKWIDELEPGKPAFEDFKIPQTGKGMGLTEAPRGALGHWIELEEGRIGRYQCVVPTTWNCSPRDDKGVAGPVEQALVGTPIADAANPIEAARVVRSFDPCIACAVH